MILRAEASVKFVTCDRRSDLLFHEFLNLRSLPAGSFGTGFTQFGRVVLFVFVLVFLAMLGSTMDVKFHVEGNHSFTLENKTPTRHGAVLIFRACSQVGSFRFCLLLLP